MQGLYEYNQFAASLPVQYGAPHAAEYTEGPASYEQGWNDPTGHYGGNYYDAPHDVATAAPAIVDAYCYVCEIQRTPHHGQTCSRRCAWLSEHCCPHCGRGRLNESAFCSAMCLGQSRRANWCPGCGVRQITHGSGSCGAPHCAAFVHRMEQIVAQTLVAPQQPHNNHHHPRHATAAAESPSGSLKYQRSLGTPHQPLQSTDQVATTTRQQLGFGLVSGDVASQMVTVKLGTVTKARKAYTAQRCRAEAQHNEACGVGAPKFGHGGEGNEQRRFIILRCDCGPMTAQLKHCRSPTCESCEFFAGGLRRAVPSDSVVTWNFAKAALRHARAVVARNESSQPTSRSSSACDTPSSNTSSTASAAPAFVAILTCRVIVGRPLVLDHIELARDDNSSAIAEASGAFFEVVACSAGASSSTGAYHSAVVSGQDADIAVVANPAVDAATVPPMVDPTFMTVVPFSLSEAVLGGGVHANGSPAKKSQPSSARRRSK